MNIYIPTANAEQWKALLADPEKHWRKGYSARTLAYSWQEADGFPTEVHSVLEKTFPSIELLLALPEHKVSLKGSGHQSQNDIWILACYENDLISIAVEGKVSEPFGCIVSEWLKKASDGREKRLAYLENLLELSKTPDTIRYQLLHRTASAIIEAQRFNAKHAVMLVHSFKPSKGSKLNKKLFEDYDAFVSLMGGKATKDSMVSVAPLSSGIKLYLVWISGNTKYLLK